MILQPFCNKDYNFDLRFTGNFQTFVANNKLIQKTFPTLENL